MAETIHVNGEAHFQVGVGSAGSGTLASLGYTVDGAEIEFRRHTADVQADTGGGSDGVPVDVQSMGKEALIRGQLVVYDEAVLAICRTCADAAAEGELETIGRLIFANGNYLRLLITSPSESRPWNFPACYLHEAQSVKLGTKRTAWAVTFRAIAYIGAGTAKGKVLYNAVTT